MNREDAVSWLTEVMTRRPQIRTNHQAAYGNGPSSFYASGDLGKFFTEADAAIKALLPSSHPIMARWEPACLAVITSGAVGPSPVELAIGILEAALGVAKAGRLGSLAAGIRAETVGELLDQAETLAAAGHLAAAAVIAGGAPESCTTRGVISTGTSSFRSTRGI